MPLDNSVTSPRNHTSLVRSKSVHRLNSATTHATSIAQAALRFARYHTRFGACNLGAGHVNPVKPWTPYFSPANARLLCEIRQQTARATDLCSYISIIMKGGVGNCGEQACLVHFYLHSLPENPPVCYMVKLSPDDHTFVVLHQHPDEQGLFPKNFSDWDEDAVVIDAWAGICVAARHYPDIWRMTLDTMGAVGIELDTFVSEDGKEGKRKFKWLEANDPFWRQILDVNEKYQLGKQPK
ncbi:hypothetical protein [Candidatus Sororendozoicomonas aggregata]|uniref:hypothetical protein n=1 Tax=Candidatus Sororendozoicomonas aggregata TaxID=3073239 RepID=UPI002ED45421